MSKILDKKYIVEESRIIIEYLAKYLAIFYYHLLIFNLNTLTIKL